MITVCRSVTLSSEISADVALAWAPLNRTATIVFRGSSSKQDWQQNFKVFLDDAPLTGVLQQMFPDAQVHQVRS